MKKILFKKIIFDCLIFFLITLISSSIIVWVFQSVNFLDLIVEDGRDYFTYINYSLLNFPKIISKILPFAIFFSFTFVLAKYEINNELITFWNFGVHKIHLINFFLKISFFVFLIQLLITSYIVPNFQNLSRSLIKSSGIDFFESFLKPKKFNDNIQGLTIYVDQKNTDGSLENIYLKKDTGAGNFQITYAKKGFFKSIGETKIMVLQNGKTINKINNKESSFVFSSSEMTLSNLDSDVIKVYKIQETRTNELLKCLDRYFKTYLIISKDSNLFIQNCTVENLGNIFKELYKRIFIPLYLPILILISVSLIMCSKENINYSKFRILNFLLGILIIIISEISLKFINETFLKNLFIFFLPFIIFIKIYLVIYFKLNFKLKLESVNS